MTTLKYEYKHNLCKCGRTKLNGSKRCRLCFAKNKHSQIGRWYKW